jgi:uncharacterized protein YegL
MAEDQAKLLPFYLVIDVSYSMEGEKLQAANNIMPELVDTLAQNPIISDKIRFGLIDFADDAHVQVPLCDLLELRQLPGLTCRGGTSFAAAFRKLREEITVNVEQLKSDNFSVHRPAVFFVSDGQPTEAEHEWRDAFRDLTEYDRQTRTGFAMYPNVIPFGIQGAEPTIMKSLIHPSSGNKRMQMYLQSDGTSAGQAVRALAEILITSVLASGTGMADGGSGIVLPPDDELPPGVTPFTGDEDDFL